MKFNDDEALCDLVQLMDRRFSSRNAFAVERAQIRSDEWEALRDIWRPRPLEEWHEDYGNVLWWILPVSEPPKSPSALRTASHCSSVVFPDPACPMMSARRVRLSTLSGRSPPAR